MRRKHKRLTTAWQMLYLKNLYLLTWKVKSKFGSKSHEEMIDILENTLKKLPKTIFIAAHLANCCAGLSVSGNFFQDD
jgi:hypothetical protein